VLESLDIWNQANRVGSLKIEQGRHVFAYAQGQSQAQSVSLTMPVRLESWISQELHPIFQMNLPEGRLREALDLALAKIFGSGDLTLLSVLGRHQLGRLGYSLADQAAPFGPQIKEDLESLLQDERKGAFEDLLNRHLLHSGVSGVQPKVLLQVDAKALVKTPHLIAKAWGLEFPQLAANEYYCLKAAQRAGLLVPGFHLSKNRELLLIERFDRAENESFLGFEDLAVLQGKAPRQKYDSSLERVAKSISDFVSPEISGQALGDLFKLCCLNHLVRNGDAHLKNFGVLYEDPQGLRYLAPVYDVVCTTAYLPKDVPALTLKGSKKWWGSKALLEYGEKDCRLTGKDARAALNQAAQAVEATLDDLRREADLNAAFAPVAASMIQAWQKALSEV
jgi:serine/threonine-protein kinase HipA